MRVLYAGPAGQILSPLNILFIKRAIYDIINPWIMIAVLPRGKGLLNRRCLLGSWYNKTMDHDSGVAERKGSLNRRCPSAAAAGLVAEKNSAGCILQRKRKLYNRIC